MLSSGHTDVAASCQAARQALQQGQTQEAVRVLQTALAAEPNHFDALCLLGIACG